MKNTIKKFGMILSIVVLIVLFAVSANALDATGQCGDNVYWNFDETTGELVISGAGAMWDYNNYYLGYSPFYESNIKSIVIENGVTYIGNYAFRCCYRLENITIPDSVTSIGDCAFYSCGDLTNITIPGSVMSIGDSAFFYCDELTNIAILDGVISIGNYAFQHCACLKSITIPDSVTTIGVDAFDACESLTSINVAINNTSYSSDNTGVLFDKNKTSLIRYPAGKTNTAYTIPNSVTSIGRYAFKNCDLLTTITIPNSVVSIGDSAFVSCDRLESVTIPDSVTSIDSRAFYGCSSLTNITIPDSVTSIGTGVFRYCSCLKSIIIPDSVTSIDSSAFYGCSSLTNITIPDGAISIGSSTFTGTSYYNNSANWKSNELYIGNHLIEANDSLAGACEIKNGTLTIASSAFNSCDRLTSVTIPDSVVSIGVSAFDSQYIQSITVDIENKYFSSRDGVLFNYDGTEIVDYPQGKNNNTYEIPYGVITIGQSAFSYCDNLECIVLSQTVKHIEQSAFYDCSNIEKILMSESLESIGSTAFYDCGKIIELDFSNTNLKHITDGAFSCCYGLKYMHLPNTLEYIGSGAFFTTYLDYIYFVGTSDEWESLVENYVDSVSPPYLQIPEKVFVDKTHLKNVEFNIVDSTCTTEGVKTTNCLCGCGYTFSEKIPVLDEHPYTKTIIEPTCTSSGYEKYVCSSCGDTYTINYTPMLEHDYKDVFTVEPTCVSNGRKNIICSTCGYCKSSNVYVPSLGHIDENKDLYCDRENCKEAIESEPFTEGIYTYTVKAGAATIKAVDNTISGDVVIPSTLGGYPVVAIGDEAFAESFNITSVVIPEGVTYIDEDAFALCYRMESVTLPESLETIENWVFGACLSLKKIVLPENVVSINDSAFDSCLSLEKIVVKNAEASIGEYICYTTLLPKDITTSEWVEKYITAYEAMLNGDENAETLIAELESQTTILENEVAVLPEVTIYSYDPSTAKTYAEENGIPFKNISELEEPHTCTFGDWFTETEPTVFSEGVSKRVCECGEFETKPIAKLESAVTKDETTKVEITYTEENFESEVELVVSEEEINANIVFGDEFENFKSFDISLEADGEKVQPNGYVTVKLPIPEGFNADSTVVYYVDDSGNKTKLESTTENGYIVFETNHFSEYVLVDESSKIEPPHVHSYTASITKEATCTENGTTTYTCSCGDSYNEIIEATGHDFDGSKCKNCDYDKADTCGCNCHKGGFMGFIWKIINFFQKLFKSNQLCKCGVKHY